MKNRFLRGGPRRGSSASARRARRGLALAAAVLGAAALAVPATLQAQSPLCLGVSAKSPEARLMAFYAAPLAFSTAAQPVQLRPWQWQFSIDITPMPSPDSARRATQCYSASKGESTNLASIFPRPRVALGLPYNLIVEASYLPPITVKDATANLFGLSLAWTQRVWVFAGSSVIAQARVHTTLGYVEGPITCGLGALQADPTKPCYGTKPSNDRFTPNVTGAELVGTFDAFDYAMYAGVGVNSINAEFQVDFLDKNGFRDRSKVTLGSWLNRFAFLVGGTWRVAKTVDLTAQIYSQPDDVSMARIIMAWRP